MALYIYVVLIQNGGFVLLMIKLEENFIRTMTGFIRKKYYKEKIGDFVIEKKYNYLIDELINLFELQNSTRLLDDDFYMRVIVDNLFDKIYYKKISNKSIINDIKKEYPNIFKTLSYFQIKNHIIKIFQVQDLFLNLKCKCCKTRKSGIFWTLCNF